MAPVKLGIIGFGFATNCFHLPFILPNKDLEVYAFLQRAAPSAAASQRFGHCTDKFPQAKHYQTAEAFFADPEIEAVIVAAHNHEEFARSALLAGKHVVVEKPFTTTSTKADELIALSKEKGKILTVFQNRRLDSDFRTVRHLLEQGALGEIKEADIHFDPPSAPWVDNWTQTEYAPGRGMVFDLGTHTIDQALVLFGKPASVTAFFRNNRGGVGVDSDIHDSFTLVLEYAPKALLVTIKTSIVSVLKDQLRFAVRGTTGSFLKFGTCPQEDRAIANPCKPADDPDYGTEDKRIWGTLTTTGDAALFPATQQRDDATGYFTGQYPSLPGYYRGYYENLAEAVRGTAPIAVDPQTSRDGIRLIELARASHVAKATVPWSESD